MGKKEKNLIVTIASALVVLASVIFICVYFTDVYRSKIEYRKQQAENLRLGRDAERRARETAARQAADEELQAARQEAQEEAAEESEHDWQALKEQNQDIYAWLSIPDLGLEYPVLQSEKDDYYLTHNADGERDASGGIYSNACNRTDFSDLHTILYGHNMKNGTMFGTLSDIGEAELAENGMVYMYTEEKKMTYRIWKVVEFSDVYIPDTYSVRSRQGLESFLGAVKGSPAYFSEEGLEISGEDKILTLSTCVGGKSTKRCLVVARLEEECTD